MLDPNDESDSALIKRDIGVSVSSTSLAESYARGSAKKYYAVSGSCFKQLCMRANTAEGQKIREYYIKLESLVPIYNAVLSVYREIENELCLFEYREKVKSADEKAKSADEKAKHIASQLEQERMNRETLENKYTGMIELDKRRQAVYDAIISNLPLKAEFERVEYLYILATDEMCRVNVFKIGKTESLERRLEEYNRTPSVPALTMTRCEYRKIFRITNGYECESYLKKITKSLKCKHMSETIVAPFQGLCRLMECIANCDNEACERMIDIIDFFRTHELALQEIPEPVNVTEYMSHPNIRGAIEASAPQQMIEGPANNGSSDVARVNVTQTDSEQIDRIISTQTCDDLSKFRAMIQRAKHISVRNMEGLVTLLKRHPERNNAGISERMKLPKTIVEAFVGAKISKKGEQYNIEFR
jgi:hypothetical protein